MRDARPLTFFIVMALLPAFGAPLTPLFLVAGVTFAVRVGLIGSGLALVLVPTIRMLTRSLLA
ncbi:MAG: hypothetical protein M3680_00055 [Myxococcota bacterium]|nr:hypothetical protein [Myxococcota bacterium]